MTAKVRCCSRHVRHQLVGLGTSHAARVAPQFTIVIVSGFLVQALVLAGNALFLRSQRRLAAVTAGECRSHRWKATRLVHHLLDLPSYELLQFAISSLGCASYVWYR